MKKYLLFLLASLTISSCSDDGSDSGRKLKPVTVSINNPGQLATTTTFTYDEKDRLATVNNGTRIATFAYNNDNQVTAINFDDGDSFTVAYGSQGEIVSLASQDDQVLNLEYISATVFTFNNSEYIMESNGDFKIFEGATFSYGSG